MKTTLLGALCATTMLAPTLATAQDRPTLTVYTYSSFTGEFGPGEAIRESFEDECGCTLDWVETEDAGTLLSRLLLEGDSTNADIVLGLDTNLIHQARETGLFAEHGIAGLDLDLPVDWTDNIFVPFDWGWFAFVYDSESMSDAPTSFAELVANEDGPDIIIEDPRTSSPGLGLLLWVNAIYGEEAAAVWETLAPRIVTVTRGWSEAYGLFLEGEADMVLSYTTSPAYHIAAENEDRYKAAIFEEGHAMQVEVAAIVASTDKPDLARSFLRFMLTDGFQATIPEGNWMYPATELEHGLPQAFVDLVMPEISFLPDPDLVAENRDAWIEEWREAIR